MAQDGYKSVNVASTGRFLPFAMVLLTRAMVFAARWKRSGAESMTEFGRIESHPARTMVSFAPSQQNRAPRTVLSSRRKAMFTAGKLEIAPTHQFRPSVEQKKPSDKQIKPSVEQREPSSESMKPSREQRKPSSEQMEPSTEQVKPWDEQPKPYGGANETSAAANQTAGRANETCAGAAKIISRVKIVIDVAEKQIGRPNPSTG